MWKMILSTSHGVWCYWTIRQRAKEPAWGPEPCAGPEADNDYFVIGKIRCAGPEVPAFLDNIPKKEV